MEQPRLERPKLERLKLEQPGLAGWMPVKVGLMIAPVGMYSTL